MTGLGSGNISSTLVQDEITYAPVNGDNILQRFRIRQGDMLRTTAFRIIEVRLFVSTKMLKSPDERNASKHCSATYSNEI